MSHLGLRNQKPVHVALIEQWSVSNNNTKTKHKQTKIVHEDISESVRLITIHTE